MNSVLDSQNFNIHGDYKSNEDYTFDIRCSRRLKTEGKMMRLEYTLIADSDEYRPFGINAKLIDESGDVIEEEFVGKRFVTVSEVIGIMKILAKEIVFPCTVQDVL